MNLKRPPHLINFPLIILQDMVDVFNFHKYEDVRLNSPNSKKIDPRRQRFETKGEIIVNLLFSAASGVVTQMRRYHLSGMDMSSSDYDGRTVRVKCQTS